MPHTEIGNQERHLLGGPLHRMALAKLNIVFDMVNVGISKRSIERGMNVLKLLYKIDLHLVLFCGDGG